MEPSVVVELPLDAEASAVPRARRALARALSGASPELLDDARIVFSELATNAQLHGGAPIVVRLLKLPTGLRIEVDDANPSPPVRPLVSDGAMTGRGLALVAALAASWGVRIEGDGKTVWAELVAADEPTGGAAGAAGPVVASRDAAVAERRRVPRFERAADTRPRYTVQLGDVPTDLLVAAKSHIDNLVREFTLAAAGAASGTTAKVPAHLAELIDTVTFRFAEARQAIKRQALAAAAAGQQRTRLELTLPVTAADAGEEYLAALDAADSYARAARLLTLETPPEHRAFRHWYVTSLVTQLRAAGRGGPQPAPVTFERYLLNALASVAITSRAAERAARLQAATAALAHATTPEQVAAAVVSEGVSALEASGGSLFTLLDDEHLAVPGTVGYPEELVGRLRAERRDAELPAADALRTGEPVWLESRQERDSRYPALAGMEPSTVSMCALPLVTAGEVLGALRFSFDRPRLFDDEERQFCDALAAQTAAALERARLFAVERQARARITFLSEATELLTSSLDTQQTLEHLTTLLVPAFADWVAVYLLDEHGDVGRRAFAHAAADVQAALIAGFGDDRVELAPSSGLADVMRTGRTLRYDSVANTGVANDIAERALGQVADPALRAAVMPRAGLSVALMLRGQLVGALVLARTAPLRYTDEEVILVEDIAARAAVAVVNAQQYARERDTALMLQRSLLPQRLPEVPGIDVAWRYLPAGAGALIGGDWYDVLPLDGGRVALVVGDVMGRGLRAAAVMGQLRASTRAYAGTHLPPSAVLASLDAAVGRLEQGQLTTAVFAVLDPSGELSVASAGHLPPLLVPRDAPASFIDVDPGPPLGVSVAEYAETTVQLAPGTTVLFYTDGLVENRLRPVDVGMEILRVAATGSASAEDLCERAVAALTRADGPGEGGGTSYDDDTALLAVTLLGSRFLADQAGA